MGDVVDDAQQQEAFFLASALAARGSAQQKDQLVIGGRVCCLDCEEPIPEERLLQVPGACRCTGCQEMVDCRR